MSLPQYIVAFSDEKGSVFVSSRAISKSILNFLGEKPSEMSRFKETKVIEDKISVSVEDNKPIITLKIKINKDANIENITLLLKEKVKTAMVEDLNILPSKITIEILDYYESKK